MILNFSVYQLYYPNGKAYVGYCLDTDFIYQTHIDLLRSGKHPMKNLQRHYAKFGLPSIQIVKSDIASANEASDIVTQVWQSIGAGLVLGSNKTNKKYFNKIDYINYNKKLRCKYNT